MASRFFIQEEAESPSDADSDDSLEPLAADIGKLQEDSQPVPQHSTNYDELLISTPNKTDPASVAADSMLSYLDERVIWAGSPSQWLNFGRYLFWGFLLSLAVGLTYLGWREQVVLLYPDFAFYFYVSSLVGNVVPTLFILYFYLKLKMHRVVITYNKITESIGFTDVFRSEQFCELSDVKDIIAPPAGWMALVRRGDLIFHTMDSDQSVIHIKAMKSRHEVKQKLIPLIRRLRVERRGIYGATNA